MSDKQPQAGSVIPPLEWLAAALGLLLVLGIVGFVSWQAFRSGEQGPPVLEVRVERVTSTSASHVVEIAVKNRSSAAAAAVQIEGDLTSDSGEVITSQVSLDFVPGNSEKRGGLLFRDDPRTHDLQVRVSGYAEP